MTDVFPGMAKYLKDSSDGYSPQVIARARLNPALCDLGRLLSQVGEVEPTKREIVLAAARERMLSFDLAYNTAVAMIAHVESIHGSSPCESDPGKKTRRPKP